jgi:hypothetical protein
MVTLRDTPAPHGRGHLGEDLTRQLSRRRELTDRPFAINHLLLTLNQEAFSLTLQAKPRVISLAGVTLGTSSSGLTTLVRS